MLLFYLLFIQTDGGLFFFLLCLLKETISAYLQGVTMDFCLLSFMFNFKILVFCQVLKEKNYFVLYFRFLLAPDSSTNPTATSPFK